MVVGVQWLWLGGHCLFGIVCNGAGPKIGLLNRAFGSMLLAFPEKKAMKQRVHQNFFSPDPGDSLNLIVQSWPRSDEF